MPFGYIYAPADLPACKAFCRVMTDCNDGRRVATQYIDFHAHILPGIDDGAANLEVSRALLLSQREQGIGTVVATPHFRKHDSVTAFVKVREKALQRVYGGIAEPIPDIVLAAEVEFYYGLSQRKNLRQLAIGNTDYILVEMPFVYWNDWLYDELDAIKRTHGLRPIVAHLDRYADTPERIKNFVKLFERDVLVQINADALLRFGSRRVVKKLLSWDAFNVLGSDCHDLDKRSCHFQKACDMIQKRFGMNFLDKLMQNSEDILQNRYVKRNQD